MVAEEDVGASGGELVGVCLDFERGLRERDEGGKSEESRGEDALNPDFAFFACWDFDAICGHVFYDLIRERGTIGAETMIPDSLYCILSVPTSPSPENRQAKAKGDKPAYA